jgi:hypothetical protein
MAVFLFVSGCNAGIVWGWFVHKRSGSLVPLIGGLGGLGAFLLLPFGVLNTWWWIPLVADLGTGYLMTATAIFLIRRAIKNP